MSCCLPVVLVCTRFILHLISPFCRASKGSPREALLFNVQPEPLNLQFLSGTTEDLSLLGKVSSHPPGRISAELLCAI